MLESKCKDETKIINFIKNNLEKKFPFLKEKNVPKHIMQYHISEFMAMDYGYESLPFELIDIYNLTPLGCENFLKKHNQIDCLITNDKEEKASLVLCVILDQYLN